MKQKSLILLICLWIGFQTNVYAGKYALVIGNSNYKEVTTLRNPVNDATAMSSALRQLGFFVITKTDSTHKEMEDALWDFGQNLNNDDVALFYFNGHGVQVDGINYLLPVEIEIKASRDVKYKSMNIGMVLETLEDAGSRLNIVILDACRDNPFRSVRSIRRGLAGMSAPKGTLVAYATAPGSVAYDGDGEKPPIYQASPKRHDDAWMGAFPWRFPIRKFSTFA